MGNDVVRTAGRIVTQSFTRPADTTAYAAGQVVNNSKSAPVILSFGGLCRGPNAFGLLQLASVISSANQVTKPDLRLYLFDASLAAQNDGAAFAPSAAEIQGMLEVIGFPASSWLTANPGSGASGNSLSNAQNLMLPVKADALNNVYGVLVANAAYTPISGEVFTIRLGMID